MQKFRIIFLVIIVSLFSFFVVEVSLNILSKHNLKVKLFTYNRKTATGREKIDSLQKLATTTDCYLPGGSVVNGFITNSRGFLTPEVSYQKNEDVFRIVVIGDSYAYGTIPYPKTFVRVVEDGLQGKFGNKKVEVINLGIPCTGPGTYERVLALEGIKYNPDLVLISLFLGNDLTDDVILNDKLSQIEQEEIFFYEKLKLYNFLKNLLLVHISFQHHIPTNSEAEKSSWGTYSGEGTDQYDPFTPILTKEKYDLISKDKMYLYIEDYDAYGRGFDDVKNTLNSMNSLLKQKNIASLYLVFPDELQVKPELLFSLANEEEQTKIDIFLPQKKMKEYFSTQSVNYIDFLEYLQSLNQPEQYYQPQDEHLNSIGNEVVAKPIIEKVITY